MRDSELRQLSSLLSRRTFLGGSAAVLSAFALAEFAGDPARAQEVPTTPEAVAQLALSTVGLTLDELQAGPMSDGPWGRYRGEWCAVYATWLLRGTGAEFTDSSFAAYTGAAAHPIEPAVGDLIYYPDPGHIGLVVDIVEGIPVSVEGNGPGNTPWNETVVNHLRRPWTGGYLFARPAWPIVVPPPPAPEEDDMVRIVTYTASNWRSGTYLAAPGYWHQFTADEWKYAQTLGLFATVPVLTPTDDRQFDELRAIFTTIDKRSPLGF